MVCTSSARWMHWIISASSAYSQQVQQSILPKYRPCDSPPYIRVRFINNVSVRIALAYCANNSRLLLIDTVPVLIEASSLPDPAPGWFFYLGLRQAERNGPQVVFAQFAFNHPLPQLLSRICCASVNWLWLSSTSRSLGAWRHSRSRVYPVPTIAAAKVRAKSGWTEKTIFHSP